MTRLVAPAKLTTSLRVLGLREDGYHLLDAMMTSLDLADEIELSEVDVAGEDGSTLEIEDKIAWSGLPGTAPPDAGQLLSATPGSNLVERALAICGRRARCLLTKHIPPGAGLGGGSSDAAAILRWAGVQDLEVAVRLGADVPFSVVGGTARVRGIGELVEPVAESGESSAFLLVTPRLHVSTPAVYAAWDELSEAERVGENGNDLEKAALTAYPGLRWWRDLLGANSGVRPRMAGSGGTWFVEGAVGWLSELAGQVRADIVASRESALVVVARPESASTTR